MERQRQGTKRKRENEKQQPNKAAKFTCFKKIQILSPIENLNPITIEEYKQRLGKRFEAPGQSGLSSELINLYLPELYYYFLHVFLVLAICHVIILCIGYLVG
jgi:hypothetical protein